MDELRAACAEVSQRARFVRVRTDAIAAYAAGLELGPRPAIATPGAPDAPGPGIAIAHPSAPPSARHTLATVTREQRAAFWLTLDAINFGSGWFPTLRKGNGLSGYHTIATGLQDRFATCGHWSAAELTELDAFTLSAVFGQPPGHELMALFAASLTDLGHHLQAEHEGSFSTLVDAAGGSAVALVRHLGCWSSFADCSRYEELALPFLKRAQIAAADLARAGVASWHDLDRLTMFADNLVPHVLRLDGVLAFAAGLVARIDAEELIKHDSPEEIEIRACALHAVELVTAARPGIRAADVDELLWTRGQGPLYKASPRHRTRCTAY